MFLLELQADNFRQFVTNISISWIKRRISQMQQIGIKYLERQEKITISLYPLGVLH